MKGHLKIIVGILISGAKVDGDHSTPPMWAAPTKRAGVVYLSIGFYIKTAYHQQLILILEEIWGKKLFHMLSTTTTEMQQIS